MTYKQKLQRLFKHDMYHVSVCRVQILRDDMNTALADERGHMQVTDKDAQAIGYLLDILANIDEV